MFNSKYKREGLKEFLKNHKSPGGIIICEEYKFIFMKTPKAAGTSILKKVLVPEFKDKLIIGARKPEKLREWLSKITDEQLKEYFIFSVARNPFSRFVSIAKYFGIPFKKYVQNYEKYWQENTDIKVHSLSQHFFTHIEGERFADKICRLESLQSDFNAVYDKLGIKRRYIPVTNETFHQHYSKYYGEEEIKIVKNLYREDLKLFEYMFEAEASHSYRIDKLKGLFNNHYLRKIHMKISRFLH